MRDYTLYVIGLDATVSMRATSRGAAKYAVWKKAHEVYPSVKYSDVRCSAAKPRRETPREAARCPATGRFRPI